MKVVLVILLGLLSAACSTAPARPVAEAGPANAEAPVPPVRHRSALATYISQRPVDPGTWREQNEQVAPKPKR